MGHPRSVIETGKQTFECPLAGKPVMRDVSKEKMNGLTITMYIYFLILWPSEILFTNFYTISPVNTH